MITKVVAIVGSYRKGGTIDSAVEAVLEGAREKGAETVTLYLTEKHIEFCTNCRRCMQAPGEERGKCEQQDDLEPMLQKIESANALVLGSPVNIFNVTAIFRWFMERTGGYAYWPWGKPAPKSRNPKANKKAVLVTSSAAPGSLIPIATGAPRALRMTAEVLRAKTVGKMWIGLAAGEPHRELSYERGCQAKKLPPAPRKGKLFGVHPARCPRLSVTRPVAVISRRFHVSDGGSTPSAREASQAEVLAPDNVPTMILCETRGL
jgi:multimeric flavodoxin WrbA